jgi:hypothetical protein
MARNRYSRPRWGILLVALLVAACGESAGPTTTAAPTTTRPGPVTTVPTGPVVLSPEFVNGVIPGAELMLLVTQTDATAGEATVSATAPGATVTVRPTEISGDEVAEVTVVPDAVQGEAELTITIAVSTEEGTHTLTKTTTILPWEDDRAEQGSEVLGLFTPWLAENRPELGVDAETQFQGTFLAPELLIVSHYGFFDDRWEIVVSWHVMTPPDDFAEIYLRDRSELRPSLAFRIESWQTALEGGDYDLVEIEPPFEVTR